MARFRKGQQPGPGRPPGCRNKSSVILDAIGRDGIENTIRMVKRKADEQENLHAADILLRRAWPSGNGRPVTLDLPPVETASDVVRAHAAVIAAMGAGEITPEEARAITDVLESHRRAIETHDHDKRLQALEHKKTEGPTAYEDLR